MHTRGWMNGDPLQDADDLQYLLTNYRMNKNIQVNIYNDEEAVELDIMVGIQI